MNVKNKGMQPINLLPITEITLIEVIHATKIRKYINPLEAQQHLSKHPANIRMDLHGVLDILPKDVQLVANREINKIVCISFVGDNTRTEAIKDIRDRILTGQIDYGVLVFTRGRGKDRFTFTDEGSKAWVNKNIPSFTPSLFIDDSTDHLRSTKHLIPDMTTCTLFNTGIVKQLLDIVKKWEITEH
jgi:hypothetical protein